MSNILDVIKPIKLLKGSHADTANTGSGCMMNVISYLNGDSIITDQPNGVHPQVCNICIYINDWMHDDERHELIPFIFRAIGSNKYVGMDGAHQIVRGTGYKLLRLARNWTDREDVIDHLMNEFYGRSAVRSTPAELFRYAHQRVCEIANSKADRLVSYVPPVSSFDCSDMGKEISCQYYVEDWSMRRGQIRKLVCNMLDDLLPKETEVPQIIIERAHQFVKIRERAHA
jgi:hypothetical protein